jgi:hypothetical protein
VVDDDVDERKHVGLRDEPLDVHVAGNRTEGGGVALWTDRDQQIDVQGCDLGDRPA